MIWKWLIFQFTSISFRNCNLTSERIKRGVDKLKKGITRSEIREWPSWCFGNFYRSLSVNWQKQIPNYYLPFYQLYMPLKFPEGHDLLNNWKKSLTGLTNFQIKIWQNSIIMRQLYSFIFNYCKYNTWFWIICNIYLGQILKDKISMVPTLTRITWVCVNT